MYVTMNYGNNTEARRGPSPSSSLPTHALAEEIPEYGIFALSSPFGSGRGCLPLVFNLKYFNNAIHVFAHTRTAYYLITNFWKEKILDKKFLVIL